MSSEVTEGQTITVNCTAESFPQSTLTLMRSNKYHQSIIISEKNLYSRPINSLHHKFNVTSADSGSYFCRAQNSEGYEDSEQKKLVVKCECHFLTNHIKPNLPFKNLSMQ